jgi:Tol biopolymer transport system component/DNA-binding winged helix-turn-helix (wHTH) protein
MSLAKSEFFLNASMRRPPRHLYEFGDFQVDAANSRLLHNKQVVPLKPKVFDTLLLLVENRGTLLSKAELMERLWHGTAVEENNLTQNISALRKVFGATAQQCIETVPKRGYRFIAEVREVYDEVDEMILRRHTSAHVVIEQRERVTLDGADLTLPVAQAPRRTRKAVITAATVAVLVLAAWLISPRVFPRTNQGFERSDLRFTRLVEWKGEPGDASAISSLSPDGRMIAYSRMKNGQRDLWVEMVSGSDPKPVTTDAWDDSSPIWSPDSLELAFLSVRGKPGIYRVPFLGGPPCLVKEIEDGCQRLVAWVRQPERIYYESKGNLFALDIETGESLRLTDFAPDYPYIGPISLSPDTSRIVFVERTHEQERTYIKELAGGSPVQLPDNEVERLNPIWLPDGTGVLYSSKRNGVYQICVTYLSGGTQQLTSGDTDFVVSDISSDGSKLLYTSLIEESDLWLAGVDETRGEHLTFDIKADLWPSVSPDGTKVAFQQTDSLSKFYDCSVLILTVEPSPGVTVSEHKSPDSDAHTLIRNAFDVKWSPDGSRLAFLRYTNEVIDLWTAQSIGSDERQISRDGVLVGGFTGMPYNRSEIRDYVWSPDGKRLAYRSKKLDHWNLCVFSLDDWTEMTVTNSPSTGPNFCSPIWSPDGRRLAYLSYRVVSPGEVQFSVNILDGSSQTVIFEADSKLILLGWSESGTDLIIGMVEPSQKKDSLSSSLQTLSVFQVSSGQRRKIAELKEAYYKNAQLSPDRRSVAFASRQDGRDNIWVLPFQDRQRRITDNTDPNVYFSSLDWSSDGKTVYYGRQQRKNVISLIQILK